MTDQREDRRTHAARAYSSQAEHPDPAIPAALIAQTRAPYYGSTPAWPAAMIGPSESELARWAELWRYPEAAVWVQAEKERAVATLVRLEGRCHRKWSSHWALTELERFRSELGLDEGF
jgi:hypothetical protein